jgi:diacylglycerol kinase family enzyme
MAAVGVALIVNPFSSGVRRDLVEDVERVLRYYVDHLELHLTEARDHATELARDAAAQGQTVVVFAGDGTYNEAINGAAGKTTYAFIPGGGTSVLPRALGLPRDPILAAERIGEALQSGGTRTISLGRANGRLFSFAAGVGFDADVVRRVDRRGRREDGRRAPNSAFVAAALGAFAGNGFHLGESMDVEGHGRAAFILVVNGAPYTYAGSLRFRLARESRFEDGLAWVAPRSVSAFSAGNLVYRAFRGTATKARGVLAGVDDDRVVVRCDGPQPFQVDGEDLGDVIEVEFLAERAALTVVS